MVIENIGLRGDVKIELTRDGQVIETRMGKNLIVTSGLLQIVKLLLTDTTTTAFDYIAIGIGTTGELAAQTTLISEITTNGGARTAGTGTTITGPPAIAQLVANYTFSGSFAVTESGIFSAASAGVMLCRKTFSAINVISGDQLQITWQITPSAV